MKQHFWKWLGATAGIMLLLPWAAVRTVQSDAGFAAILLLLFGVDPLWCVVSGYLAGKCLKECWAVPLISAVLFLMGTWLCFEMGEPAFALYAGIYLLLGSLAMAVSHVLKKRREQNG